MTTEMKDFAAERLAYAIAEYEKAQNDLTEAGTFSYRSSVIHWRMICGQIAIADAPTPADAESIRLAELAKAKKEASEYFNSAMFDTFVNADVSNAIRRRIASFE